MQKYADWIFKFLVLGFFAYIIFWYLPEKDNKDREYWENLAFKTDTVKLDIAYPDIKLPDYPHYVPPKVVINYIDSTSTHVHIKSSDSLIQVIDSLRKEITSINPEYLKKYPKNPKLIYGEFQIDSLRLDLLNIDGKITTELYSLNYNRFKYQYKEGQLKATEISGKKLSSSGYLYAGYNFPKTAPLIGADYSLYKARYRLSGFTNIYIQNQPTLDLGITLGYKWR